jgi:hypothetical protein
VHRLALVSLVLALAIGGCGGDDDGGGSDDATGGIESCLEDAGLDVRSREANGLDEELVAAGATKQFLALDVNQQEYSYDVTVFSAPDKASAYAQKQQAEYDKQPELKFQSEAFEANVMTTTSDAPKREDVSSCAAENG